MSQYYYFIATLPRLAFDEPAPTSSAHFLEACRRLMSESDYIAVRDAKIGSDSPRSSENAVAQRYFASDRLLRNALVEGRAQRLGWDAASFSRPEAFSADAPIITQSRATQAARGVLDADTPKRGEQDVLQLRWRIIEELESGHYFDVERLVCYHLKLQLLERKDRFQRDAGEEQFHRIVETITEPLAVWHRKEE